MGGLQYVTFASFQQGLCQTALNTLKGNAFKNMHHGLHTVGKSGKYKRTKSPGRLHEVKEHIARDQLQLTISAGDRLAGIILAAQQPKS